MQTFINPSKVIYVEKDKKFCTVDIYFQIFKFKEQQNVKKLNTVEMGESEILINHHHSLFTLYYSYHSFITLF